MLGRVAKGLAPHVDWQRIESGGTGEGIPDVNYCGRGGVEGWLEGKYQASFPMRHDTPVFGREGLSASQIEWLWKRHRLGARVWILAGVGREAYLIEGAHAHTFNQWGRAHIQTQAVAVVESRMSADAWAAFAAVLLR